MTQTDPIVSSTSKMCIAYQDEGARLAALSRKPPNWATLGWIAKWQEMAAEANDRARIRLDRLNGHA